MLVVDEAQLLRSRNATKVLATLVERVPAGSTLALVGRLAPSLPIARLRADGRLLEVRGTDLALNGRESEALLRSLDADLTDDEAAELLDRCEGWAAGISLSALASRERAGGLDDALPGGDDRFLAEYFRSEFLAPLTDELRTFLRRTSVLERLTAPVCDAVLKQKDSSRVLASLERRHLLLAPLDRHGEAYRCHPLFRDLLARELGETEPALVVTGHRRAADWFEAHGDPESALAHAEASGDVDRVARIVAAIALPTYYRGRIAEVEGWLERFDDESQLERYPAVAVLGGWFHALGGRHAAAERWLAAAERGAALEAAPDDVSVAPAISVLRAALCRNGVEQMRADIESALADLPPEQPVAPHGAAPARMHAGAAWTGCARRRGPRRRRGVRRAAQRDRHAHRRDQRARAPRVHARRARVVRGTLPARASPGRGVPARRLHDDRARARRLGPHVRFAAATGTRPAPA